MRQSKEQIRHLIHHWLTACLVTARADDRVREAGLDRVNRDPPNLSPAYSWRRKVLAK
jgi:hypothetical protein